MISNHSSPFMQPTPSFHQVEIKSIEDSNSWSLHPFLPSKPSSKLLSSIKQIGILHPPILLQNSNNKYKLLCGKYRVKTYQTINPSKTGLTCLVIDKDTPSKQILFTILEDQLLSGSLSSIEKAYFFKYCLNYMKINEAAECFLPILNEKVQIHTIKKLSRFLELEPELQLSMHYARISDKTAQELLTLTPDDRRTLHNIFLDLELGGGKQNRLLALSKDLAYREGTTITEFLSNSDYKEILLHPEMNQPQKIANLLTILQKKLIPQSSKAEEAFLKQVHKMNLPAPCSITHSQAFERDDVSLTVRFTNLLEVEKKLSEIKRLVDI